MASSIAEPVNMDNVESNTEKQLILCKAIIFGDLDRVQRLLSEGLNPDFVLGGTYREVTPLMQLVQGDESCDLSECLNEFGQHNNSCSPLILAVVHNRYEIASELLRNGADIEIQDDHHQTAIFNCFLPNVDGRIMDLLLERNCNINHKDMLGRTPLVYGVLCLADEGYSKVKKLIQNGCDVCQCDEYGCSVLHRWDAAHEDIHSGAGANVGQLCEELFGNIFENGGDALVNSTDKQSATPLHFAVDAACPYAVDFLLQHGANPHIKDMDYFGPILRLSLAANVDDFRKTIDILTRHVDINTPTVNKENILFGCTHQETCPDNVRHLLEKGADVRCVDQEGKTPLHALVENGKDTQRALDIVDIFLAAGADIDRQDNDGRTPLHCAVLKSKPKLAERLLQRGSDVSKKTKQNHSITHFATQNEKMIHAFTDHSAINVRDINGSTPLHWAVSARNFQSFQYLLKAGGDPTLTDSEGRTPTELAEVFHIPSSVLVSESNTTEQSEDSKCLNSRYWLHGCGLLKDAVQEDWEKHIILHTDDIWRFSKMVLNSKDMGLFYETQENSQVSEVIVATIKNIMRKVGDVEPLFAADIVTAGSVSEGTKCGFPNELDVILHLKEFTKAFQPTRMQHIPRGYTMLQLKDPSQKDSFSRFMVKEILEGKLITDYLYVLFQTAALEVMLSNSRLEISMHVQFDRFSISFMTFCWTGTTYKQLDVSVDLVPAVQATDLDMATEHRPLYQFVVENSPVPLPLYIVLRTVKHDEDFLMSTLCYRLSTSCWETAVFNALNPNIRKAYIIAKALLIYSPFSTQVHMYNDDTLPYVLQGKISFVQLPAIQNLDEIHDTDEDAAEGSKPREAKGADAEDSRVLQFMMQSIQSKEICDEDGDASQISSEEGMDTDVSFGDAETFSKSTVTSYMLKSALFQHIDMELQMTSAQEIFCSGDGVAMKQILTLEWAKKICKMFLKCIEEKRLNSYFLGDVNLLTDDFEQSIYDLDSFKASIQRLMFLIELCEKNEALCP